MESTNSWPELAIGLYDRLTGRNAEIQYTFDHMEVDVPGGTGAETERAPWRLNGTLRVTTQERAQ